VFDPLRSSSTGLMGGPAMHSPSLIRRLFANNLFLLALQLTFAVIPPAISWLVVRDGAIDDQNFRNTLTMLTLAAAAVWFVMARLRAYAKARLMSYVVPVNFLIYSGLLAIIAVVRIDYSAYLIFYGIAGAFVASFVSTIFVRRAIKLQFVVPGGRTDEIVLSGQYVTAPELIDLHHTHSPEWERLFAKAALAGVPVYHYRQIAEMQTGQVKISHLSENDLGSLIPNAPYMTTKRAVDIIA